MSSKTVSVGHGSDFAGNPSLPAPIADKLHSPIVDDWLKAGKPPAAPPAAPVKKKATLKDIVNEYGEAGTAHGIPIIITSGKWWAKLFWLIISCGLAAVFGYQGVGLMLDYFSYPYTTNIDVISKTKVEFPAVTICNMNRMRRSELVGTRYQGLVEIDGGFDVDGDYARFYDFSSAFYDDWYSQWDWEDEDNSTGDTDPDPASSNADPDPTPTDPGPDPGSSSSNVRRRRAAFDSEDDQYLDYYMDAYDSLSFENDDQHWDVEGENDWEGFYEQSKAPDYSDILEVVNPTREELEEFGHQAEDFILQCTFDKRGCNYTDFRQFQNNQYGNCYTFNHGFDGEKVRKTSKTGSQYGLHLTLLIEQPEYVGLFSPETGVRVTVHSAKVQPSPEDAGITAATGMATSIGIRQNKIDRLGGKYTKPYCTQDGSDTRYKHPHYTYSSMACRRSCLQTELNKNCGCVTDVLIEGVTKCSYFNPMQQLCRKLIKSLYNNGKIDCICPDVCDEILYPTSVSNALWPSKRYEEHLYQRVSQHNEKAARTLQNVDITRKNVVRLRIYYEELNYQVLEQQKAWSIEGISGAVGGLMGLYLGISAVSILEILIFLLKVLIYVFSFGHVGVNKVKPTPS